ncbi:MAG TPA: hypothetical protein VKA30_03395 [Actinomycetota bacterium]|nr:hypothetical protein [Actinomycetota bacterium]
MPVARARLVLCLLAGVSLDPGAWMREPGCDSSDAINEGSP